MMSADWTKCPKHLLDLVVKKLESSKDYLQFGVVCIWWHSVMKDNEIEHNKRFHHHQIPMLLVPSEEENSWDFYNALNNKFTKFKLSVPHNKGFSGSSYEWLVSVNEDYTVTLYKAYFMDNNIAPRKIHLPSLFPPHLEQDPDLVYDPEDPEAEEIIFPPCEYHVHKVVVEADLATNPNEFTVAVIFGEYCELAFIRYPKDTTWTRMRTNFGPFDDVLCCKNRFYAISWCAALISFDITNSTDLTVKLLAPRNSDVQNGKKYLIESNGEFFQVNRYFRFREDRSRVTTMFQVFRLDVEATEWVAIASLGELVIFLGDNTSISVSTSNFIGCQRNCIYFTHDEDDVSQTPHICDLGVYEIESNKFRLHYSIDSATLRKMSSRRPIWVIPTLDV